MKFKTLIFLYFFLLCYPLISSAHPGGHFNIAQGDVIPIASEHVMAIVKEGIEIPGIGKLDQSWNEVHPKHKKIIKKEIGYYIVSFAHPKEKKILYLLLSSSGDLYDANFSGQFEGLKN
jgi:hypothetical protein